MAVNLVHGRFVPADVSAPPFALPADARPVYGLDRLGRRRRKPPEFTLAQMEQIRNCYAAAGDGIVDLASLATELGKSRHNISRFARRAGLTRRGRPQSEATKASMRAPKWQNKPHPRGMAGKSHSIETRVKIGSKSKQTWALWKTFGLGQMKPDERDARAARTREAIAKRPASTMYTRTKGGHRPDLGGVYFRSSWEANYARYLNLLIKFGAVESWQFEPETFWFEGIRRGVTSYKPDFRITYRGDNRVEYVEIKGWVVPKDRTKWARMKKYHPSIKLVIVGAKEYYALQKKWASSIPNWERQARNRSIIELA